jgi:hypothetical protein
VILTLQRRMMELGRCRLGTKGTKGEPKKLDTFRWTSASRTLLEAIAASDGGTVQEWKDAPDEGMFEIVTERSQVDIIIPPVFSANDGTPTTPYSQWFELWSAAGCQRRCDGQTEALSGKPCLCAGTVEADGEDARECKVTTRFSFMRPDIPGLGVWRLESHGWNSAVELPGTLEVMMLAAAESKFIPAVLRIEHRTKKQPGQPTKKFIVPVIDLPGVTVNQLVSGDIPLAINAPVGPAHGRPALPAGPPPPADPAFEREGAAEFGEPPAFPETSPAQGPRDEDQTTGNGDADTGGVGTSEWAAESDVTGVLEVAARVGPEAHEKTVDAIAKHRAKLDNRVNREWLAKLSAALLKKAPAAEPEGESQFQIPEAVR